MKKLFVTGLVLGIAGALALFHYVPVVDQSREISIISVMPNGGTSETFRINFPSDRILLGGMDESELQPAGISWPASELYRGTRGELFKVRNERDAVIGVASRLSQRDSASGDVVEWVLHLPARGSLYATMDSATRDGIRFGDLRAGTREFDSRIGSMSEQWVEPPVSEEEFLDGRIELVTTYVARQPADGNPDES